MAPAESAGAAVLPVRSMAALLLIAGASGAAGRDVDQAGETMAVMRGRRIGVLNRQALKVDRKMPGSIESIMRGAANEVRTKGTAPAGKLKGVGRAAAKRALVARRGVGSAAGAAPGSLVQGLFGKSSHGELQREGDEKGEQGTTKLVPAPKGDHTVQRSHDDGGGCGDDFQCCNGPRQVPFPVCVKKTSIRTCNCVETTGDDATCACGDSGAEYACEEFWLLGDGKKKWASWDDDTSGTSATKCSATSTDYARLAEHELTDNLGSEEEFRPMLTWEEEKTYFSSFGAMKFGFGASVRYTEISKLEEARRRDVQEFLGQLRAKTVPGLSDVTFGAVFRTFAAYRCPLWLVGGAVRDILAGKPPNDVDCAALCHPSRVSRIIEKAGWTPSQKPDRFGDHTHYFSIGERVGDYLEGVVADLFFRTPFEGENSVSQLRLSPQYGWVIDPTGRGVEDAERHVLRPSLPPTQKMSTESLELWFGLQDIGVHRYLKMRLRGWQPVDAFRRFMGAKMHDAPNTVLDWFRATCPVGMQEAVNFCRKLAQVLMDDVEGAEAGLITALKRTCELEAKKGDVACTAILGAS